MGKNKEARAKETRSVLGERTKRETDVPLEQDKCNCYVTLPFPVYAREKKKKDKCPCMRFLLLRKMYVKVAFRFWHLRLRMIVDRIRIRKKKI